MTKRRKPRAKNDRAILFIAGLIFFGMGSLFMWFMGIQPALLSIKSSNWPQISCTVTSSYVDTSTSSDGNTYKAVIELQHFYNDHEYTGGSYDFDSSYSSGYSAKKQIVAKYPEGAHANCWVNPDNPSQAVLDRSIPGIVWIIIPFTSIFILIGVGFLLGALGVFSGFVTRTKHSRVSTESSGHTILRAKHSARAKIIGFGIFALFWNGIVSLFLVELWQSFAAGQTEWGLGLFLIPFVAVGLFTIGLFIHACLASFNPKPILQLNEGKPKIGQSINMEIDFDGNPQRISQLTISLEGYESATYSVGTQRRTDTHTFFKQVLLESQDIQSCIHRSINIHIPENTMHSFSSSSNAIHWVLKVHGDIPSWPDINDEYPITVRPL